MKRGNELTIGFFQNIFAFMLYTKAKETSKTLRHAHPSGLKKHSRREEAFKEGNLSIFLIFRNFIFI